MTYVCDTEIKVMLTNIYFANFFFEKAQSHLTEQNLSYFAFRVLLWLDRTGTVEPSIWSSRTVFSAVGI